MRTLMSFVGCIGTLLANTGLSDLIKPAFAGVEKILSGKNISQNTRVLRICAEEILRSIMHDKSVSNFDILMVLLNSLAKKSRTAHLWLNTLILPVILIMRFVTRLAFARLYFEVDVGLLWCGWALIMPLLRFGILNENDAITQKFTQKAFRWGSCYVASKRHMELHIAKHEDGNHCQAIRA